MTEYVGNTYKAVNAHCTPANSKDGTKTYYIDNGDIFKIIEKDSICDNYYCEFVKARDARPGDTFIAYIGWIKAECELVSVSISENQEPPCVCPSPAVHLNDCEWMKWRKASKR